MKKLYSFNRLAVILAVICSFSAGSADQGLNSGNEVTQNRLDGLPFENANKFIPQDNTFPNNLSEYDAAGDSIVMTGIAGGSFFGYSVSSAGDVNHDGYSDVIAGANGVNQSYIFFGSPVMDNSADLTLNGGRSVSSAGNVNGDLYSDVITGTAGIVNIYFGGASMNNTADVVITGSASDNFGESVSSAGDVNDDGFSDVIVGAKGFLSNTGRAYIYFGGPSMDNVADVIMTGALTGNNLLGASVSSAGDVNNDGYSDVIVGAPGNPFILGNKAYIYLGGFSMDNIADVSLPGSVALFGSNLGVSVSTAGDFNADGFSDVIVGADGYNSSVGAAFIFYGGSSMDGTADVTMNGLSAGDNFGASVSSANMNLDGFSDIIAGAPGSNSSTGKANVQLGNTSSAFDVIKSGEAANNLFGHSVSSAGDVNGDGYPDVIVGAPGFNANTGRAYVYLSSVVPAAALKFDGVNDYVALPNSLTSAATGGTSVTIEYWFKGSSIQSAVRFQPAINDFIVAGWNGLHIISSDGGTSGIPVGAGATDGNWHHVAMTWQKNTVNGFKSYLDGNLVSQRNSSNANLPSLIAGGYLGSYLGNQEFMNGSLDEVRIWNRALPQYEIQTFRNCQYTNQRTGLLAYYKFNQGNHGGINTGVTSLSDYSIYNYTAVLNNFALTGLNSNWITPGGVNTITDCLTQISSALNFNGLNNHVQLTESLGQSVANTTAITIEYWFKGADNQSAVRFQGPETDFIVAGWNGKHIISIDGGTTGISQGAAVNDGNWHHVAMTWQKNTVNGFRSFLDGLLVEQRNSANVNLPPFAVNMVPDLGSFNGSQEFMLGSLDEVRIWNRALSQAEIQFTMNCEIPGSAPGLLANYHFNQGFPGANNSGVTNLDDAGGNLNFGTLYNFTLNGSISNWISPGGVISGTTCTGGIFNITAVPEGFYNSGNNTGNKRDTLRAFLHSAVSPYNVLDSAKTVMDSLTFTGTFTFANSGNGTYYIRLKHRNSIETWSKPGGEVYNTGNINSYDFTVSAAQAFGSNMKQVDNSPVRYAIFSGDVNQNGIVDLSDLLLCFNDAGAFVSGYTGSDLNGDNLVDLADITIVYNNSAGFIVKITP